MSSSSRSRLRVGTANWAPMLSAVLRRPRAAATARFKPPRISSRLGFTIARGNSTPSAPDEPCTSRAAMLSNPFSVLGLATGTTMRRGRCTTSLTPSSTAASSPKLTGTASGLGSLSRVTDCSVRIGPRVAVTTITASTLLSTV